MQTMLGYEVSDSGTLLACDVLVQSNICSSQDCALERALRGERVSNFEAMVRRRDGNTDAREYQYRLLVGQRRESSSG